MHNRITELVTESAPVTETEPAAHTQPPIPPQLLNDILHDYHRPDRPLTELAAAHDLSIPQLLDILESPAVSHLLDRIARQSDLQAKRIAANAYPVAINRLFELAEVNPNHSRLLTPALEARARETTRKAAAQLVRIHRADHPTNPPPQPRSPSERDNPPRATRAQGESQPGHTSGSPLAHAAPRRRACSCNGAPSCNSARAPSPTQTPPSPSVPLRLCVQSASRSSSATTTLQTPTKKQPPAPGRSKSCSGHAVAALPTSGP